MRVAAAVERRRRVARRRREAVAEHVRDDDEILCRVERAALGDRPFEIGMLRAVGGRMDDDVRLRGIERAVGLVGEPRAAIGQPRLQDDVAGLEDLVIRHQPTVPSAARRSTFPGSAPVCAAFSTTTTPLTSTVVRVAARVLVRLGVGRAVLEIGRVEDRDVGPPPFLQQAAVLEPQRRRGSAGHLAHRNLQRQQLLLVHVMAEDAREGPVKARMRHALGGDPVIGDAIAVRADQRRRRAHDRADVVLGDRGDQHARRALVRDQKIAERIERVTAARSGDGGDRLAGMLRQVWRDRDLHSSPRTGCGPNC